MLKSFTLPLIQTGRQLEAEQSYKYALKVGSKSKTAPCGCLFSEILIELQCKFHGLGKESKRGNFFRVYPLVISTFVEVIKQPLESLRTVATN